MRRTLIALITLIVAAAYVGRPLKAEDASKERIYVRVFFCFDSQSVLEQRQSEKQKIIAGYLLSSIEPNSDQMKACAKDGILMTGYVQITPPFASLGEVAPSGN
jgi:hypothetical protein